MNSLLNIDTTVDSSSGSYSDPFQLDVFLIPQFGSLPDIVFTKPPEEDLKKSTVQERYGQLLGSVVSDIIRFNVGGQNYNIGRDIIKKYPQSLLAKIASGEIPCEKDLQGRYIINREGDYFGYVLDYLENGISAITNLEKQTRQKIREELLHYNVIEKPVKKSQKKIGMLKWKWDANVAQKNGVALSERRTRAVAQENDKGLLVGELQFVNGVYEWRIKIGNKVEGKVPLIAIGVLNKNQNDLFLNDLFLYKNTWGITTDGEKLLNGDIDTTLWLMEMGDQVVLKYDAHKKSLIIKYSKKNEIIVFNNIEGEIYPYACLLNPSDFIITSVM